MEEKWIWADHEEKARALECFETPEWCIEAILKCEIMPLALWDPCAGPGIMGRVARRHGYDVRETDIFNWGNPMLHRVGLDFISSSARINPNKDFGIIMNPPFSKATDFIEIAFARGARKILCFQRFAWWESAKRREFWSDYPPNRIYVTESRASCWRIDIPPDERGSSTPTAYAWYVFEPSHPTGTLVGRLEKLE